MNSPVMQGLNLNSPCLREERETDRLGGRHGRPVQARQHLLVRRQRGRIRPPVPAAGRRRHLQEARPGQAPQLLPGLLRPDRRGPRRRPHLHLLAEEGRRRPHQQLDGPGRNARHAAAPVRRLHARPHHVRGAVLHGPAGLADRPHRHRAVRQPLRGGQHAHHDAHGQGRVRRAGRQRRVRALRAHRRRAAGRRARRT